MVRGGKRNGSGRHSGWHSGCKFADTQTIRVPRAIAAQVLQIAHRLDMGDVVIWYPKVEQTQSDVACPQCKSTTITKDGIKNNQQSYQCKQCRKKFRESTAVKLLDCEPSKTDLETS